MHQNSKIENWKAFYLSKQNDKVDKKVLALSELFIADLQQAFNLDDTDFSLTRMITYYVNGKIFGNIRFNKYSLKIEPLFAGMKEIGYHIQMDGYIVHSFKISNEIEYRNQKDLIFMLLKLVYDKKQKGTYENFIKAFDLKLIKYLKKKNRLPKNE